MYSHLCFLVLVIIYNALIKPVFSYASVVWQTLCSKNCPQRIFRFQKRAARVMLAFKPQTPSVPVFNRLQWLPFYVQTKIAQHSILYQRTQLAIPDYLIDSTCIKLNISRHTWSTRFSNYNFICPCYNRSTEGGRSFLVQAVQIWNNLPSYLKKQASPLSLNVPSGIDF